MNKELWQKFNQLRSSPFSGHEGLADYFQKEGIRFSARDLATWGQFLSARFGRSGGEVHVPEWLAAVFCALANQVSPKTICDPWAGVGFLIGALREACLPEQSLAFTQNHAAHELGKVLIPEVDWQLGEPLRLLDSLPKSLDVVASILPMNARAHHPLKVTLPSGATVELTDDLGNLVLVAASMRLSSSGVGFFVVTPSFFLKQQSVFHRFSELGLGMEGALALPSGTFAPYTNIPAYLIVVRRRPSTRMFVAQLSADANTNAQVIANFRQGTEGGSLELGRFVAADTFRSIGYLRASDAMTAAERRFGVQASSLAELGDVKSGIILGRPGDDFAFQALENAIYIPLIGNSDVMESPDELKAKGPRNFLSVISAGIRS